MSSSVFVFSRVPDVGHRGEGNLDSIQIDIPFGDLDLDLPPLDFD